MQKSDGMEKYRIDRLLCWCCCCRTDIGIMFRKTERTIERDGNLRRLKNGRLEGWISPFICNLALAYSKYSQYANVFDMCFDQFEDIGMLSVREMSNILSFQPKCRGTKIRLQIMPRMRENMNSFTYALFRFNSIPFQSNIINLALQPQWCNVQFYPIPPHQQLIKYKYWVRRRDRKRQQQHRTNTNSMNKKAGRIFLYFVWFKMP